MGKIISSKMCETRVYRVRCFHPLDTVKVVSCLVSTLRRLFLPLLLRIIPYCNIYSQERRGRLQPPFTLISNTFVVMDCHSLCCCLVFKLISCFNQHCFINNFTKSTVETYSIYILFKELCKYISFRKTFNQEISYYLTVIYLGMKLTIR